MGLYSLLTKFSRKEIDLLFQNVKILNRNFEAILLAAPARLSYGRILIVIPKRIGSAPVRNKLRRRIKAIFYEQKLYEQGKDCICIVKNKQFADRSFDDLLDFFCKISQTTAYNKSLAT